MTQDIPRDRWDRPLIIPVAGGKQVPFTRVSRLAKATDDVGGLVGWAATQAILGLTRRRDLYEIASQAKYADDPAAVIRDVASKAKEAAASDEAANFGTVIHRWTELLDTNQVNIGDTPEEYQPILRAYLRETAPFEFIEAELFVVCDELGAAGTLDRLFRLPDGAVVVADIKTSKNVVKYGAQSVAVQTATYSHGQRYDPVTGKRSPLHPDLDPDRALLIHMPLPTEEAPCRVEVHQIDASLGWYGAQLATGVLAWRKTDVLTPWFLAAEDNTSAQVLDTSSSLF